MQRGIRYIHLQLVRATWTIHGTYSPILVSNHEQKAQTANLSTGASEDKEDTAEQEYNLSDLYREDAHKKQPFAVQGLDSRDNKEDSDGEDAEEDEEVDDDLEPDVKLRGDVYEGFDDLGELDEFEQLDDLDELDEIALGVDQKDFEPDSLMGISGEVPIDEEVLNKLEMIKENRGFAIPSQQQEKADDEHLRFKTQERQMEEIATALGTYIPPASGKPFKARKVDILEKDLQELKSELGPKHPRVLKMLVKLAGVLDEHKKYTSSESIYRSILKVREEVWGKAHESTAIATIALGNNLRTQGKIEAAEEIVGDGMDMLMRASPDTVKTLISVGGKLLEEGEVDKAEGMHQAAVVLAKFTHGECHTEVVTALRHLVQTVLNSEHFEDAEGYAKEELRLRKQLDGEESPEVAVSIATIGYCCMAMQNYREADLEIREGLAMRRKLVGKVDQEVGRMTHYLGEALMALGMHKEAEDIFKEGISIYERLGYQRHPILASAMICLSDALLAQNKLKEHHSVRRHAIAMHQKLGISVFGEE